MAATRNVWVLRAPPPRIKTNGTAEGTSGPAGGVQAPAALTTAAAPLVSLFCFSPAGSGACAFHGWELGLPAEIEVLPVELPGRNSRIKEVPISSMHELIQSMLPALLPFMDSRPFAFFGHSMGAWVAYCLAQELQRRGGPLPFKVYASANRSPLLAGTKNDVDPTVMHQLPPANFWNAMHERYGHNPSLEHAAVRRMMLPVLQADFKLIETWDPLGEAAAVTEGGSCGLQVLPCPLAALGATEDGRYSKQQLETWRDCAAPGSFQQRWFEGGHSYATTDCPGRRQLLEWLAADLRHFMPQLMPPLKRAQPPAGKNGALGLAPRLEPDSPADGLLKPRLPPLAPRRQTADRDAPLPAAPAAAERRPRAGCSCLCW